MKIIFLDIDGVLNNHERFENGYCGIKQENVRNFNSLLKAVPEAKIVISSSWRYMMPKSMSLEGFTNLLLSHGVDCALEMRIGHRTSIKSRLVGAIPKDEQVSGRGYQILSWMKSNLYNRTYDKHVILDDMLWDFGKLPFLNVVQCDPGFGLLEPQVQAAIRYLL